MLPCNCMQYEWFQAIWVKFPEFGSIEELIQRYTELKKAADRQNFAPNIDGNKAADARNTHFFNFSLCKLLEWRLKN